MSKPIDPQAAVNSIRASSTTSGGGFVERELAVARGFASCRGDDERLDEAESEVKQMRGENAVLLGLLTDCAAVLRTIEADDTDEAEKLRHLLAAIDRAHDPQRHKGALL